MRDQILKALRPSIDRLVNEFAEKLSKIAEQHISQIMNQLELAFDVATSAFESDLQHSSAPATSPVEDNPGPTQRSNGAATPDQRESAAVGNVAEPHRAPGTAARSADVDGADTSQPSSKRGPKHCRLCGEEGKTSQSCGITHNVPTSTASDGPPAPASTASSPATSPISRSSAITVAGVVGVEVPAPPTEVSRPSATSPTSKTPARADGDGTPSSGASASSPISRMPASEPSRHGRSSHAEGLSRAPASSSIPTGPRAELLKAIARRDQRQREREARATAPPQRRARASSPPTTSTTTEHREPVLPAPRASFDL